MEITERVASVVAGTGFADLPSEVVSAIKDLILDSVGCALGGSVAEKAKIGLRVTAELGGQPRASIIGGSRSSVPLAAFANGELINALDFDAIGPLTGHLAPYVIPPCLALAEYADASGKELIASVALGVEIGGRVASSLGHRRIAKTEPPYFEWLERFSYSPTIFGALAGGAKAMRLNELQTRNALGVGGVCTPVAAGEKYGFAPPTMTKYNCWSGHIASLAATAVLFARSGFTGDMSILDGERGFWKMYGAPFFKHDIVTQGLGSQWHMDKIEYKPYPAYRSDHAGIDAIRQIMKENGLDPRDVETISVWIDPIVLRPAYSGEAIENSIETQFCNRYIFAIACCANWYEPGPCWQLPETYGNTEVKRIMKGVMVEKHPRADEIVLDKLKLGTYTNFRDTLVEIVAKGKKYVKEVSVPKGSKNDPMTRQQLCDKFLTNASYSSLDKGRALKVMQALLNLETVGNVNELTRLFTTS